MGDKKFPGESALEALFGAIKSSLSSKQNQTLSTTIAGSSTVEGALQALEQSSGGTDDYSELDNKPQINGVELSGNKTASDLGINIPTNLSDLNDDSTHRTVSDTEKSAWNGKADTTDITNAINALDVESVGGTGKYISEISETDGKISATAETMDDAPTENSNAPVKSGGIKTAIDDSVSLKTATGNPITLTDAANANAEELSMTIEPIQSGSGDPSPTNIRPISGLTSGEVTRTGKNICTPLELGTYDERNGVKSNVNNRVRTSTKFLIKSGAYCLSFATTAQKEIRVFYLLWQSDALTDNPTTFNSGWLSNGATFNVSEHTYISIVFGYADNSDINVSDITAQLEYGTTPTTFEPYTGATASITFGQTVYGGSVNFKTGEVTVTHVCIEYDGSNDEDWIKPGTTSASSYLMEINLLQSIKTVIDAEYPNIISNYLKPVKGDETWGDYNNFISTLERAPKSLYTGIQSITTVADWRTYLASNPLQVCYELATFITLTLTPAELELLKGNNTITANGAEISLSYYPDNAIGTLAEKLTDVQTQIANRVEIQNNAGFHNSIYRGKNLGTEVTQEQWNAISAGTFDDMYIGDYWTINGVNWRIAHFNYWLNTGDTECTTPHIVLVPDTNLYNAHMNTKNVTTGGYVGSEMYTSNLAQAKTTINNAFGASHILSHRELLTNSVSNDDASGWAWYDSTVELMSEVMVYGGLAWSVGGKGYEVGIDKEQLALFRLDQSRICNRARWWLRSVNSATSFAFVTLEGVVFYYGASYSYGVRPAFAIKA